MSQSDPFADFKAQQRQMWPSFSPTAIFTTPVAGSLVAFAGIAGGERVLTPGGRVVFATWPPEHFIGKMFALVGRNSPPPPAGAALAAVRQEFEDLAQIGRAHV